MDHAKNGDKVTVHFTGKTDKGDVFATTEGQEPLEFTLGDGTILPGVDTAVEGMEQGEKKTVSLPPKEGFGERHDDLVMIVDRSQFPEDFKPEVGLEFQIPQPDGTLAFFKILEVLEDKVKLDANHPLAGQTVVFELELLDIATV